LFQLTLHVLAPNRR